VNAAGRHLTGGAVTAAAADGDPAARRRRLLRTALVVAILVLLAAAAVLLWGRITSRRVSPAAPAYSGPVLATGAVRLTVAPAAGRCPRTTFTFTGAIPVRGRGAVTYQWLRPDGVTDTGTVNVAPGQGTSTAVLEWTLSSSSQFEGTATLRVVSPPGLAPAQAAVRYDCP
jgi:hypothetical protein